MSTPMDDDVPTEPPRKRRLWPWILLGLIVLAIGLQFRPSPLRPGPDTTAITGPLRPDGSIDYAAALNEIGSKGVTPENNAVVLLAEAIGPRIVEPELRQEFFEKLGVALPPETGEFLRPLEERFIADGELLKRVQDDMEASYRSPWQPSDYPELAEWLGANEKPLELCVAASEREAFYLPLVVPAGGTLIDHSSTLAQQMRWVARLLRARATLRLGAGDVEGALADVNAIHRLAHLLSRHPLVISRLVATALDAVAASGDATIIQSGLLTAEQARRQRQFLGALPPFGPMADVLDRGERYLSLDAAYGQFRPAGWNIGRLDPNAIYRRINSTYDDVAAALKQESLASQQAELRALSARLKARATPGWQFFGRFLFGPRWAISSNIGDGLCALLVPALEQSVIGDARARLKLELVDVGYALAEYKSAHGSYPETLDVLVPDLLNSIPGDPFGDGAVKYVVDTERGTFLLYGVGANGTDDAGRQSGGGDDVGFGDVPE